MKCVVVLHTWVKREVERWVVVKVGFAYRCSVWDLCCCIKYGLLYSGRWVFYRNCGLVEWVVDDAMGCG